jgi:N-acetylneuraminic acid mutarotase
MNDFYRYDPDQNTWSQTPGTSGNFSKRRGAVAFIYMDKAYIVTGSNSGGVVRDFWLFDPSQPAAWHRLSDIINDSSATYDDGYSDIEREYATAFVNGSQAFLTTGDNTGMLTSTWAYDIPSDRWSRRTAYPRASRNGAVSFTVSGRSFLGTGNTGSNSTFDDFDEFQPIVPFNSNDY